MNPALLIEGSLVLILGGGIGYVIRHYVALSRKGSVESAIEEKLLEAKRQARSIEDEALTKVSLLREEMKKAEDRILKQEERLDKREEDLVIRDNALSKEQQALREKDRVLQSLQEKIQEKEKNLTREIEKVANISQEEARAILLRKIASESEEDIQSRILKLARDGESRLEEKAKEILVSSIYRIANGPIAQFMTATVEIDDEDIKGKIIGKEGRNIKTFERMSGVEVLVDEIPNGIVISCFDPVRRAIAKNALEMLIKDGRIQPVKIEECLERAKKDIGIFMRKKGEEAVLVCEIGRAHV